MREALSELPRLLTAHLQLSLFALLVGVCLSVPLGIFAARSRKLGPLALGLAGAIQTVPSLALLALMVPLLAGLGAPSIGYLPAFIALVLYSVLPVLRNTVTGLAQVDPALIEAARGVGMSSRDSLYMVELPSALPMIIAGIRTATVWTVGAATLATPVGATSLGNYIFAGLQTRNIASVLVGCLSSAALALFLDAIARMFLVGVERRSRRLMISSAAVCLVLYLYTAASAAVSGHSSSKSGVTIGAKTFTEQYILAEALSGYLKHETDTTTEIKASLGSSVLFDALRDGSIDVYIDYSGTIWSTVMKRPDVPKDAGAMLSEIKQFLHEHHDIELTAAMGFENSYALALTKVRAEALGVRTISDLARHSRELEIGGDYEFFGRPEWQTLKARYGIEFRQTRAMDSSLMYQAAASGDVDVVSAFSTDGRIAAFQLMTVEDNLGVIPHYDAIVLANGKFARTHPDVMRALRKLSNALDVESMRRFNMQVDQGGQAPRDVAREVVKIWQRP